MQENISRFEELNAQVLGISVDSVHSHKAYAEKLGGLSFPLLADFHPKGETSRSYGVYSEEKGYSKRSIFILDPAGIVRHTRLYLQGLPDVEEVLAAVKAVS